MNSDNRKFFRDGLAKALHGNTPVPAGLGVSTGAVPTVPTVSPGRKFMRDGLAFSIRRKHLISGGRDFGWELTIQDYAVLNAADAARIKLYEIVNGAW